MIIAVDLDGTLVLGKEAIEGAKNAISTLREHGHYILIHSCNRTKWIEQCLNNLDIRFDAIWDEAGKPQADLYVDDKGCHFNGDWDTTLKEILERVN